VHHFQLTAISELMQLINNNASCNNRVLGLLLGPSAGLYGIVKRSALAVRGKAHCSAFERTTHRGSIVLFYPVGGSMANAALPMQCPSGTFLWVYTHPKLGFKKR
jgi:hypothetical protein